MKRCDHPGCPIPEIFPPHNHLEEVGSYDDLLQLGNQLHTNAMAHHTMMFAGAMDPAPWPRKVGKHPVLAMGYGMHDDMADALALTAEAYRHYIPPRWRCGWLLRWGSLWVGAHWSKRNKRLCLNLLPCVTLWVTAPGGKTPAED
jgi:hypothetical protein